MIRETGHRGLYKAAIVVGVVAIVGTGVFLGMQRNADRRVIAELSAKLDALESQPRRAAVRNSPVRGQIGHYGPTDHSQRLRGEHQRRLLEEPGYANQVQQKRLNVLNAEFEREAINPAWAAKATTGMEEAIVYALDNSNVKTGTGDVDCRSTQCRVRINLSSEAYDDFLTYLSVGAAKLLPKARIVTLTRDDGTLDVSLYSSKGNDPRSR